MRALKLLLLAPAALALGGCLSYGGGEVAYSNPYQTTYPSYQAGYPTYPSYQAYPSYPAYSSGYPGQTYYSYPQQQPQPQQYYPRYDRDGDGVANNVDRYPYDPRRW
ncbi:MAG: hypothetical protein HY854_24495 [Burkholderiales bacterium]|nr:hypothetical protein [Burkholderiales bacterium]